ncbi:hypothetical protein P4J13_23370 [Bacillus anthracis]|uniref:hypothetical protein n=1 Tax=Bacillus anthracis TaxID=1392 RepID=UPI002DBC7CB1|nr:hypothetical protein [Bacillus anthracis]MEB9506877.1 hypothetical protein [Bacillus anthracis]
MSEQKSALSVKVDVDTKETDKVLTLNESRILRITHPHKINPDKIQTLEDVVQILKRLDLHVDDEGLKGIEYLIEKDDE